MANVVKNNMSAINTLDVEPVNARIFSTLVQRTDADEKVFPEVKAVAEKAFCKVLAEMSQSMVGIDCDNNGPILSFSNKYKIFETKLGPLLDEEEFAEVFGYFYDLLDEEDEGTAFSWLSWNLASFFYSSFWEYPERLEYDERRHYAEIGIVQTMIWYCLGTTPIEKVKEEVAELANIVTESKAEEAFEECLLQSSAKTSKATTEIEFGLNPVLDEDIPF